MTTRNLAGTLRGAVIAALAGMAGIASSSPAYASDAADKARAQLARGDERAATIVLKDTLQKDPGDVEARLLLGEIYLKSRDGAAAEKELRRAAELNADPARWLPGLAESLILQGRFSDALDRLDGAVELPGSAQAEVAALRGDANLGLQRPQDAEQAYARAIELDPGNERAGFGQVRLALSRDDVDATIAATDAFLERHPESVEALILRGELHRQRAELEQADRRFTQALERSPNDVRALLGQATIRIGLGRIAEARAALDRADSIQKDLPMTLYLRGLAAFQDKDWTKAGEYLQRVLGQVPGHLQSQLLMGIISYSKGELQIAEEYLSRVVPALPDNVQAAKILAATRIKLRQPDRAIEVLEPLAGVHPDPQLLALIGSAYVLKGDQERGQEWLSRAVELSPDAAALRTQLGLSLLAGGDTDKAISELQSAVDLGQGVLQADVLLVLAHLKNKEYEQAVRASEALEKRMPNSAIPYNLTGLAYLAQDQRGKARQRFEQALKIDPAFVTAELNLARVDMLDGDAAGAKAHYERVLAKERRHLAAMLGMSALAERRGDDADLVAWLTKAQEANPGSMQPGLILSRFYVSRGEALKALNVANDLSSRFPNDADVLEALARAQTLAGQTANAIRSFEQLSRLRPESAELFYLLGGIKWKAEDLHGALRAFQQAVELKPDMLNARVALSAVQLQAGRVADAIDTAKRMQREFPKVGAGFQLEGTVYLEQKRPADAIGPFLTALEIEKSSQVVRQLAQAYADAGRREEALKTLEGWLAEHPDDQAARGVLAMQYQLAGRNADAAAAYEKLAAGDTRNVIVLNNLAWLYQEAGDPRALETARKAYDLDPNRPEVADTYGWTLVESGRLDEGLSILQQAYVSYPTQTEIGYHVGVALSRAGRTDEAVKLLRRLLRDNPSFEQAAAARALLDQLGQ